MVLVLLSGGQDSTTCLYWALQKFSGVRCLIFNYGQKHIKEIEFAERLSRKLGLEYDILEIEYPRSYSALLNQEENILGQHKNDQDLPASFVPGRNMLFLAMSSILAYTHNIEGVVIGVNAIDYSGYPDCRTRFIKSMEKTISLALNKKIYIYTPLLKKTKAQIWKLAKELGCLEDIISETLTDYNGDLTENEWGYGRLDNSASILRKKGFDMARKKGWL